MTRAKSSTAVKMKAKSLDSFPDGSCVTIKKLCDCPSTRGRLCALGLTPGAEVEVCCVRAGTCRLKARGADIVLADNLACAIFGVAARETATRGQANS